MQIIQTHKHQVSIDGKVYLYENKRRALKKYNNAKCYSKELLISTKRGRFDYMQHIEPIIGKPMTHGIFLDNGDTVTFPINWKEED